MSNEPKHVLVIGGGVIGIACAYYLREAGNRVTVVDKGRIGGGCSHSNCGLVSPSHVLPLAEPGAIADALKSMLRPNAPFRIRPRLDIALWKWLWKFARRCNHHDQVEAGRAIHPLLTSSFKLYEELIERENLECVWQKQGLLFAFCSKSRFEAYSPVNELLTTQFNEPAKKLSGEELCELEPALKSGLAGAWYYEHDAHLHPESLLTSWHALLENRGVKFIEQCSLEAFDEQGGGVSAANVSGDVIRADAFVVATGAWTPQLSRILRCRVPVQPGKGYSMTFARPATCPRVPMLFPEHRVAVTPMGEYLRIGSIMEFSGYDTRISDHRLRLLTDGAAHYLREMPEAEVLEKWYGWRPMTYDSTPIIGPCPGFSNVFLATGHNMLGLSMAPATGRLISELVAGTKPHVDAGYYSTARLGI